MAKKSKDPLDATCNLLRAVLGDWWLDSRRNWCAYCGIAMQPHATKHKRIPPQKSTKDHVISKKHNGTGLTIPACRSCNDAKGAMAFQEFLLSNYFARIRKPKHRRKWSIKRLWMVASLAALEQARAG